MSEQAWLIIEEAELAVLYVDELVRYVESLESVGGVCEWQGINVLMTA